MKIELHTHTSEISQCSELPCRDLIELYKQAGYDAVVIANHFSSITENYLAAQNCKQIRCAIPGYTLFPNGIDEKNYPQLHQLLLDAGYEISEYSYSMERSLEGYSPRGCKRVRHNLATKHNNKS